MQSRYNEKHIWNEMHVECDISFIRRSVNQGLDAQKPEVSCKNICFWVGEIDMMKVFVSKTFVLTKWVGDIIFLNIYLWRFWDMRELPPSWNQIG